MFQRRLKVVRRRCAEPEYGYTEPRVVEYQRLLLQTFVFGLLLRQVVIDTEIIPEHVVIELGCFGSTDWKSKWASVFPEAYA